MSEGVAAEPRLHSCSSAEERPSKPEVTMTDQRLVVPDCRALAPG